MRRGELYLVANPLTRDPKRQRVFVIVSRQVLIDSRFSTGICAPIYTTFHGLATQFVFGPEEGLKYERSIHCDELVSLPKSMLTNFMGALSPDKMDNLEQALRVALDIPGQA